MEGPCSRPSRETAVSRGLAVALEAVQPAVPEEEEEKRVTAAGDPKPAGDESSAVSQQILNFLLGLKTLKRDGVESRNELEEALYAKRFELLFPEDKEGTPTAARAPLPQFQALPQQQLLKEFLMSGKLLGGHQSVAHVLYPEAVHWPHQLGNLSTEDEDAKRDPQGAAGSDPENRPGTANRRQSAEHMEVEDGSATDTEEEKVEVVLCGKRVQSTVRGRQLKDILPDRHLVPRSPRGVQPLPEARFRAAQETRKHLERAVKMEEYQERRIAERIQALEIALDDEIYHQKELQKRQKRRELRQEELKKDLDKRIEQRLKAEEAQKEDERRQKELEKKEKEKLERYYKAQKEKVEQWQAELSSDDFFNPMERARKKRFAQEKEALLNALAEEERKNEHPPLKRLEVERKLQEQEDCLEQRPFMAPKAHDQPRPILQMMADNKAKGAAAKASPTRGAWRKEVEGVSKRYGLSAEHLRTIEARLQRTASRFRPTPTPAAANAKGGG